MLTTCATCGEQTKEPYCQEHKPKPKPKTHKPNPRTMGYDYTWAKLSKRARRLQPFCLDCGTTQDLTADHTPQAWKRKEQGKPIRLQDIEVVCRSCNAKRGPARGDKCRSNEPNPQNDINTNYINPKLLESNPGGLGLKLIENHSREAEEDRIIFVEEESIYGNSYEGGA